MRDVTFGITAFERPKLLTNLIRSIKKYYPTAKIVVANNGRETPPLPDDVKVLVLPFDSGLSRARNALINHLDTKYLLILEDDFLFLEETKIEPMVEVLEADREVGCVGGALRDVNGRLACYALDIEVFRDKMEVREATHRVKLTPSGSPYRLCDMVWNFCLFRKEMLADHRWNDRLKVGEHCPYFHQVKLGAKWRVATTNQTAIYHVPQRRSPDYLKYRRRAQRLFESYLAEHGIKHYHRVLPFHYEDDAEDRPCVVVLGAGHSGTTVLTQMLHGIGWNAGDADKRFGESVGVRRLNIYTETNGALPPRYAQAVLDRLPRPWAIKDPRFVKTLHHWLPHFERMERKPILLRIRRDRDGLLASYQRRQAPGDVIQNIDQLLELCQQQYDRWPWQRLSIEYARLGDAVSLFSMDRFRTQQSRVPDRFGQFGKPSTQMFPPADGSGTPLQQAVRALANFAADGSGTLPPEVLAALDALRHGKADGSGTLAAREAVETLSRFSGQSDGSGLHLPSNVAAALQLLGGLDGSGFQFSSLDKLGGLDGPGFLTDGSGFNDLAGLAGLVKLVEFMGLDGSGFMADGSGIDQLAADLDLLGLDGSGPLADNTGN